MSWIEDIRKIIKSEGSPSIKFTVNPEDYRRMAVNGWTLKKLDYGIRKVDEHCPYKQGQFTMIVGNTNIGKTRFILYLLSRLVARHGTRGLIYSAENRVQSIMQMLMRFHNDSTEINNNLFDKWIIPYYRFIEHKMQHTYKSILEQCLIQAEINDYDWIFIDPYNSLKMDHSERINSHEYHYEAAEEFRLFCLNSNKSLFLNCHTLTEQQRERPNEEGITSPPLMSHVEGGAKFPNKSDDCLILHRSIYAIDEDVRNTTNLFVGKVRNSEFGGMTTSWKDPIKFRYLKTGYTLIDDNYTKLEPLF